MESIEGYMRYIYGHFKPKAKMKSISGLAEISFVQNPINNHSERLFFDESPKIEF